MKRLLLITYLLTTTYFSFSQSGSYSFSASSGSYVANALPTQLIGPGVDDQISAVIPIGFNFVYGCETYSQFAASSNGWIGLGSSSFFSDFTNNLNTSSPRPRIAPLWDDLATGSTGDVNYLLTGTAPNRILTIEWKEMEWSYSASVWALSFQVKLYETSNQIDFIYTRNGDATLNITSASASIGLSMFTSGSFYSLNGPGATPTVSTATETTNINTKPATDQVYRWNNTSVFCTGTPANGTASASPMITSCSNAATTLSASGATIGCGLSYQWQSSPNGSTWTNIPGATTVTSTVNNNANTFYRLVTTCTGSGLSATSSTVNVGFSGTPPPNDFICNAAPLTLGVATSGTTECASGAGDPASPACWYNGNVNSVWYTIQAPASGIMKIKTILLSSGNILQNTQIAVYNGTCTSLNYVDCNDNAAPCGGYGPSNSELTIAGVPLATYYIVVDGYFNQSGSFQIVVIDGVSTFPLIDGQDCPLSFPLCSSSTTIGNPGYQSIGGQCDNAGTATTECTSGEANSVWYNFQIGATGVLEFDIVPNDYGNPNPINGQPNPGYTFVGSETDYDWVLWKISGSGATNCTLIMSSGGDANAVCNYSGLGVTGCTASGNTPPAYPGFDGAYEVGPAVVSGDQFVLAIHNFANSTSGFTLQFPPTSPVVFAPTTTLFWTGGAGNSSTEQQNNWGGCGTPTCGLNAVVTGASSFQPILTPGIYNVNTITINPGSTLTIQTGATLNVCGDFINNGSLVCEPGSLVVFVGPGTQNITGGFINANGFHNMSVNKLTGFVIANNDIDVKGNFLTTNATSIFNSNSKKIRVAGNFTNNNGNLTYTNTGATGILEFFGTTQQIYNQGSSQLDLNQVNMNHTGTNVLLATNMFIKALTGSLNLTLGKIETGTFRVDVNNSANTCVSTGNASSYVFGNLYRTLNGAIGGYDFPVGSANLYQRANITFISSTSIPRLMSRFDLWGTPPNHINGMTDCANVYNFQSENNGFWTINASANPTNGNYNTTLYCNGATNTANTLAWTVEKSQNNGLTWILDGICDPSSLPTMVKRNNMNGFSLFAAAQATVPLPIELKSFYGTSIGRENKLNWITESEYNADYFILEHSKNGIDFTEIDKLPASGSTNQISNYESIDMLPFHPITYYRLIQVDLNGKSTNSNIISIDNEPKDELNIVQIFPNPTSGDCTIEFYQPKIESVHVIITDLNGNIVLTEQIDASTSNMLNITSSKWHSGMYFIRLTSASGQTSNARFIKR